MKPEINLTHTGDTLTILEGKTLDPKPPVKIAIDGHITAPAEFLKKRFRDRLDSAAGPNNGHILQKVDIKNAVLVVDEDKMTINLSLDPENIYGTEITSKLEFTEYLESFHINQSKQYSRTEVVTLLKFSRLLFRDQEEYTKVLGAFQRFDMKAFIEATAEHDDRGNRAGSSKKEVKTNLPESFILRLPIFKGQKPEDFKVDICLETINNLVTFWFESAQLNELIDQRKIEIFQEQLQEFQDFVIIRK